MRILKSLSLALGFASIAPTAHAAQLTLNFDAFIPTPRIVNPAAETLPPFFTEFIGDDRGFDFEATQNGEARLFTEVVLDTEADNPLVSSSTGGGTTVGFLIQDGVEVSQTAQASATSEVKATRLSDDQIFLQVAASAQNPLIVDFLPPEVPAEIVPPAEYIYDITLTLLDEGVGYDLSGTTREFPSYSVFLNESPILLNPANANDSSLLGNIEAVSASGIVSALASEPEAEAVNEPATLLGLALVMVVIARCRKDSTVEAA